MIDYLRRNLVRYNCQLSLTLEVDQILLTMSLDVGSTSHVSLAVAIKVYCWAVLIGVWSLMSNWVAEVCRSEFDTG